MRPSILVLMPAMLALAASGLGGCNRHQEAPPPAVAAAPAPSPVAPPPAAMPETPPPVDGQPVFPAAGTPYADASKALIGQGMVPYLFAAAMPGHPECSRKQGKCVFTWTDKAGFASYVIVATDPAGGAVQSVGFSDQDEVRALNLAPLNLAPLPAAIDTAPAINPFARDPGRDTRTTQRLPNLSGPYGVARDRLIAAGFTPIPGKAPACRPPPKAPPAPPPGAAPGALAALPPAPAAPVICRPPGVPPEIHGCAVVGVSACQAVWSRDNQVLVVNTQGDPAPGAIDNLYWATAAEAADYRAGRK